MAKDVPVGNGQLCWRMFAQLSESSYIMCRMGEGVAEQIGVKRTHYIEFETGNVDYYPKEIVDKLAGLYQIPVEDLLDEYNQFLYTGQGKLIREYRERMGLQKKPFARRLGIDPRTLRGWENETIRVKRGSWERYFKENIEIS